MAKLLPTLSLALFHLVGPLPSDLGVHGGALSACASPTHCARANWSTADPLAALAALVPVLAAMPRARRLYPLLLWARRMALQWKGLPEDPDQPGLRLVPTLPAGDRSL